MKNWDINVVIKCEKTVTFFIQTFLIVRKKTKLPLISQIKTDLIFVLQRALMIDIFIINLISFSLDFRIVCVIFQVAVDKIKYKL